MTKFFIISFLFSIQALIFYFLPVTHGVIEKASAPFLLSYTLWFYIIGFYILRDEKTS